MMINNRQNERERQKVELREREYRIFKVKSKYDFEECFIEQLQQYQCKGQKEGEERIMNVNEIERKT